jgi:hypothetical protein
MDIPLFSPLHYCASRYILLWSDFGQLKQKRIAKVPTGTEEASSIPKRTISTSSLFLILWVIFASLDLDPQTHWNPNQIRKNPGRNSRKRKEWNMKA